MGILVDQRAAALRLPGGAPCAAVVVSLGAIPVRDDPCDPLDMAQLPLLHHLPQLLVYRVGPLVVHDAEFPVGLRRGGVHLLYLLRVDPCRLLRDDVQAVAECLYGKGRMEIMGRGDDHRIAQAAAVQLLCLAEYRDLGILLPRRLTSGRGNVADCSQLHARHLSFRHAFHMYGSHVPETDYA